MTPYVTRNSAAFPLSLKLLGRQSSVFHSREVLTGASRSALFHTLAFESQLAPVGFVSLPFQGFQVPCDITLVLVAGGTE